MGVSECQSRWVLAVEDEAPEDLAVSQIQWKERNGPVSIAPMRTGLPPDGAHFVMLHGPCNLSQTM